MMFSTFSEVIFSIFSSIIFGVIFGAIYHTINEIPKLMKAILKIPKESLVYSGSIFSHAKCIRGGLKNENKLICGIYVFISVFIFAIGYILLTYYSCDGEIRLYTFLFSVFGIILSTVFKIGLSLLLNLIYRGLFLATVICRFGLFPLHVITNKIHRRYKCFLSYIEKRIPKCREGGVRNEE